MRSIRPISAGRARMQRPVPKIILPRRIKGFGSDPLMTPLRLPHGVSPAPYATKDIYFAKGAHLDVTQ